MHTTTDALDIAPSGTPRWRGDLARRSRTHCQTGRTGAALCIIRGFSGYRAGTENELRDRHFRSQSTAARPVQSNPNNPARFLNRQAQRRAQERAMQESIQKRIRTAKNTARRTEQVKQAALRAGKAIVRAAVGLLGHGCADRVGSGHSAARQQSLAPPLAYFGLAMTATHNRFHRRSCRSMANSPQKNQPDTGRASC